MFNASSWLLLEPPFLTVKLLRKLTGILEVPGILDNNVSRKLELGWEFALLKNV